ncbi:MAG: M3 family oligoendopeptidase [Asgard group archaeon]|nr:M3 family oligoendopeptidase [Asgard group archaeon]
MSKHEIAWDLSDIYPDVKDPSIDEDIKEMTKQADKIRKEYKGKIISLKPEELATFLDKLEEIRADMADLGLFANLSYAAQMTDKENQKLHNKVKKLRTVLGKKFTFVNIEMGELLKEKPEIINDKHLVNYKHYLEKLQREVPHQLSETEEQLILEKDQFGVDEWQLLQSNWLNTREFEVEVEGEKKILSYGEANALLTHKDRATRESANKAIYSKLKEDGQIFATALRNICSDWLQVCERRKFDSPMHDSLIINDVQEETVTSLLDVVEKSIPLYKRYLKLKAKMMNLPILGCHDVVAPLPDVPEMEFDWEEARKLVTKAYVSFDEDYAHGVKDMFKKDHIDGSPRMGKRNGAFCAKWYNGKSAFILLTYTGKLREVYTLAHELGHATHDYYATKKQTLFNTSMPMVVAETASIFGELLLTDLLLKEAKNDDEKKVILSRVLDGAGQAIFQVSSRAWFETSLYEAIQDGEFLNFEAIADQWTTARDTVYKDVVEWFDVMESEWCMKPHYFMSNFRYYNYPYTYAQLFVYALYRHYLEEGKTFVPKFKKILSAGSSLSPKEIGEIVELDITDPSFWGLGMKQFEYFVNELEKIVSE